MADAPKPDRFYDTKKSWMWFGISSIVFLVVTLWMILDDFGREWKGYQAQFLQIKQKLFASRIELAKEDVDADELATINEQIKTVTAGINDKEKIINDAKEELSMLRAQEAIADTKWRTAKAGWDVLRYEYEAKYGHYFVEGHPEKAGEKGSKAESHVREELNKAYALRDIANTLTRTADGKEKEIDAHFAEKAELTKNLSKARGELDLLEAGLKESKFTLTKLLQSLPILDLANPVFRVNQVVVPTIRDDMNFATVGKVDRCTTCHLGIDQPGFENQPQPFRTHPRLETILGSSSPHPIDTIGCTVCHEGRGGAVDFTRAAHTPRNPEQQKEWEKKYHWHSMHHVEEKMLPLQYVEGRCQTCHTHTEFVPKAQKLNEAVLLVRNAGCFGCHRIEGWDHMRKPAPSLERAKGKLTAEWITKWVADPASFNERARMPKVFHLENTSGEKFSTYQDAEITAISTYLLASSDDYTPDHKQALGTVESGKEFFGTVGCLGCHSIDDYALEGKTKFGRAPDLSTVGSKVSKDWLTSWLKNPRHYWANTTMPSLRLKPQEIGNLSAYLLSKKNAEFDAAPVPGATPEVQKEVLRLYLTRDPKLAPVTEQKLDEALAAYTPAELSKELGRRAVGRYGCYGCHDIKGFEGVQGIGTELSDWGMKPVKKLDFGHSTIAKTRHSFIDKKLEAPRSYDTGTVKEYLDLLRMPHYGFTSEEREAVGLLVMGRTGVEVKRPAERVLTAREAKAEEAYRVIHKYNCQGCHVAQSIHVPFPDDHPDFEAHEEKRFRVEGQILSHYEDETVGPPVLINEGAKVKSDWVHNFIENPFPLRARLQVRMPSYNMPNNELNTLVEGWANEGGVEFPYLKNGKVAMTPQRLALGRKLFGTLQCLSCHTSGESLTGAAAMEGSRGLAPDFWLSHERLHKQWIANFLDNPQKWIPGTRMPGFWPGGVSAVPDILGGDPKSQQDLLADYLYYLGQAKARQ